LVAPAVGCSLFTSWAGYVGDGDGGVEPDAQADTGGHADTGTQGDTGVYGDTGMAPDTGMPADTGMPGDTGTPVDTGPSGDAGSDATESEADAPAGDAAQDSGTGGSDGETDAGPIVFVQVASGTPSGTVSSASATFTQAQVAGDLIVMVVGWAGNASLSQVSDSVGNGYAATIAPTHISAGINQAIYYAKGIAAAPDGGNTVTVTLGATTTSMDLRAAEYSGLDPVAPYDTSAAFGGRATTGNSGPVSTTTGRELVFGAGITVGSFTGPGSAFTLRKLTGSGLGVVEDHVVSATGSYSADAPLAASASYIMQIATFR
jgi:hypothetical protein